MSVREQKRAEYDARKLAQAQAELQDDAQADHRARADRAVDHGHASDPGWRFGIGPDSREGAEISRAQIEGRSYEYSLAQAAARAREQAEPKPKRKPPKPKPAAPPRSEPPTSYLFPVSKGEPDAYGNGLLADHARARIKPVTIAVPDDLPDTCAEVARFVALVIGLRLSCGDDRPAPLARGWVAAHLGLTPSTVARALGALRQIGFLTHEGSLPARGGKRDGTALYGIPGITAPAESAGKPGVPSDGVPVAGGEPGAVAVEAQKVGATGSTVEPRAEPVDKPGVSDAVALRGGGPPTEGLDGVAAPGDGAGGQVRQVQGHGPQRYARRPTVALLLARAIEGPVSARGGSVRDDALWLACQLRDHDHDEHGDAYEALLDFASRQPASFTSREALRILRHAYGQPRREPWGSPAAKTEAER